MLYDAFLFKIIGNLNEHTEVVRVRLSLLYNRKSLFRYMSL